MTQPPLGDQELEVLRYVTDHAPITVRQTAIRYGEPHGLARTTILTVMERLRNKGYLQRAKTHGAFEYSPMQTKPDLLRNLVQDFVRKTLGGSVSPFVAYLADTGDLSELEIGELRKLVTHWESEQE